MGCLSRLRASRTARACAAGARLVVLLSSAVAACPAHVAAGPFLFQAPFVSFAVGEIPYSVAIGDLNGDGRPDLATPNYSSNTVSVLLGNGNGTFGH